MIRVEKLNKTYDRHHKNANHVLKDVTFQLPQTGFVCILGPSGCGKTSLLNAIGGLDRFDSGTIATDTVAVSRYGKRQYEAERNRNFGYIFQNYYLLSEHSVAYNIYLGLHSLKLSHKEKLRRIRQALEAVDMGRYIRRKVGELSGGQQQRIAIARALARRPRVIFADEPTGNLDEANTMNICTILRKISRESLVIMVTHEERIANFFADRIIRLDGGRVAEDASDWQRSGISLSAEKELYAGDYAEERFQSQQVALRVLQEEGAAPVEVTVVALKDRILIKLADNRAITCGAPEQVPALKEGSRPTLTLEAVDREHITEVPQEPPAAQTRAGRGIGLGMMRREAKFLATGSGAKRLGMRLFLILLTALTLWTAADYLTVSAVDPRDYVTTHSQVLELKLEWADGIFDSGGMDGGIVTMDPVYDMFADYLWRSGLEIDFIPPMTSRATFSNDILPQMAAEAVDLIHYDQMLLSRLDPRDVILGRMPEKPGEIVVDTWILEAVLEEDTVVGNSLDNVAYFLDKYLHFERNNVYMTVVGICDSGEPALYLYQTDMLRLTNAKERIMSLSELKAFYPGEYDHVTLEPGKCIVNTAAAGSSYESLVGGTYYIGHTQYYWTIQDTMSASVPAKIIICDADMQGYTRSLCDRRYTICCQDKEAVKAFLAQPIQEDFGKLMRLEVLDNYAEATQKYMEASRMKVDTRTIVTVTVMVISMVMLYLLCRTQARERIGMLAVYRLLGIPRRKLWGIFALEAGKTSLQTALPTTAVVWVAVTALNRIPSLELKLLLPASAALAVYGCILLYHMLVALLPLGKLLRIPPAQLAAKIDF